MGRPGENYLFSYSNVDFVNYYSIHKTILKQIMHLTILDGYDDWVVVVFITQNIYIIKFIILNYNTLKCFTIQELNTKQNQFKQIEK